MSTRADVVREARTWLGTRWRHQQSVKGVGTDCVGFVAGVGVNLGLISPDWKAHPEAAFLLGYGRTPYAGQLERGAALFLESIQADAAGPGDVVLMHFGDAPHHAAILGDYRMGGLSIIHAYAKTRMVCESRLDCSFRARIVSWHRFPGVEL